MKLNIDDDQLQLIRDNKAYEEAVIAQHQLKLKHQEQAKADKELEYQVGRRLYSLLPPSEPYVKVSLHTAQAFLKQLYQSCPAVFNSL